ncbi:hypothetical protein BN2476_2240005 [Paraburkholderia piptadeniae]|uniref:Uncharacterized protein n=1 Tax=Paraburkholderia piptadeniae TaxID=1701573 RepID=A0A1N7SXM5_9BURK|nr:hypothetical protein BN2476_2240005 [Paraburkholderia piptadeniae]
MLSPVSFLIATVPYNYPKQGPKGKQAASIKPL